MSSQGNGVLETLKEARALIERGWTQAAFAVTKTGRATEVSSPRAVAFCAVGAIRRASRKRSRGPHARAYAELVLSQVVQTISRGRFSSVTTWNDAERRTQAQVLRAFDKAIKLRERELAK